MRDSEKERIKLFSTFLNNTAVAFVTLGFVSPLIAATSGIVNAAPLWRVFVFGVPWFSAALGLHLAARRILGDLDR